MYLTLILQSCVRLLRISMISGSQKALLCLSTVVVMLSCWLLTEFGHPFLPDVSLRMGCTSSSFSQNKSSSSSRQTRKTKNPATLKNESSLITYDDESQILIVDPPTTLNRDDFGDFTFVQCGGGEFI
jgi:hypothetical protein